MTRTLCLFYCRRVLKKGGVHKFNPKPFVLVSVGDLPCNDHNVKYNNIHKHNVKCVSGMWCHRRGPLQVNLTGVTRTLLRANRF